jgi:prepilin-type N-terminal cleavage/methylation domain-containing protein
MHDERSIDTACTRRTRGFTLIELCLVISIISILTSLGTASYAVYVSRARAAEAVVNVETLAYLEQARILDTGAPIACAVEPATIPAVGQPAAFSSTTCWRDLGFKPTSRVRFQYSAEVPEGRRFVVRARGDLDGDGAPSEYWIDSATMKLDRSNPE